MPYEKTIPCRPPDVGAVLKPALSNKDRQFYRDVRKSNECVCGREKHPPFAFCYRCYEALTWDLQEDINVGADFAKAYEEAVKYLEEQGIINNY